MLNLANNRLTETRFIMAVNRPLLSARTRDIGTYSRPATLAKLDGRTKEAALMRWVRAELLAHVGGRPTFPQSLLIDRAAVLALRLTQIEAKMLSGEVLTLHDNNHAIAWHNAFRRTIAALGLAPAAAQSLDAMEAIRRHVAAAEPPETP